MALLSYASYAIGGVLVVAGVMKFKHHAENPTNAPLAHGFARVGAGAALLALPFLMGLAEFGTAIRHAWYKWRQASRPFTPFQ